MTHLICFATTMEAEYTLQKSEARHVHNDLYHTNLGHILITGMGPEKTREKLNAHIGNYDEIINFGIVGALKKNLSSHELHTISHVTCRTMNATILLQTSGLHLITSPTPLHDPIERDELANRFDLIDMEGYSIAEVALQHGKRCTLKKVISDFCTDDTSETIRKKLPELSERIYSEIVCHNFL